MPLSRDSRARKRRTGDTLLLLALGTAGLVSGSWIAQSYLSKSLTKAPASGPLVIEQFSEESAHQFATPYVDKKKLKQGWFPPETWGVWSNALVSELSIPVGETYSDTRVSAQIFAFTAQEIKVEANGTQIATWRLGTKTSTQTATIPKSLVNTVRNLEIKFTAQRLASPSEGGKSRDTRQLGIGLTSLTLAH
ncbi:hypothetical protein [Hyphomicrobium sp. LHD-15]|uniref:hypothetical protein n=1 Tax=Hyphomicrobium sp. LHD-15 TaxID=3072142 RepID=UPI00280D6442|nr:hypothetical protein [Hyphomicrobium sp. LHD-15]MDQ8699876.1 hypothetical protein [Hyphomicrobium sp. LHD-15]